VNERRLPASPSEELDRAQPLAFSFDGRRLVGLAGDSVGSALAAGGVRVITRSFKYHRPRGLLCCAGRCPNCLVEVDGTPNVRACTTALAGGTNGCIIPNAAFLAPTGSTSTNGLYGSRQLQMSLKLTF